LTTEILKYLLRAILLIALQVLIVQNINLSGYIILLPYVLAILMLPFETNRLLVLFLSFVVGISIDYFYDSSGIHASACTIMGFARYYVLKYVSPREGYDAGVRPSVEDMGLAWYLTYAGTLIAIHHLFLFYLEIFRFSEFFRTLFRIIMSTAGTLGFIYLIQFLLSTKRERK
jgi:hypothetical protein